MDIELKQNLSRIIRTLEEQGMKPTKIAHAIGYTTTRQMYNTLDGKSMLSTKAVKGLILNLNVNPLYLFLGKGDIFLSDESELETLRKEKQEWIQRHNEAVKTIIVLNDIIKRLEKKNDDLIEISSAALKNQKVKIESDINSTTTNDLKKMPESNFLSASNEDILNKIRDDVFNPSNEVLRWLRTIQKDWVNQSTNDENKKNTGKLGSTKDDL